MDNRTSASTEVTTVEATVTQSNVYFMLEYADIYLALIALFGMVGNVFVVVTAKFTITVKNSNGETLLT